MKANEMPERVYLFDYNDAMVTPIEGDTVYVREDAFIEKAIKFFAPHIQDNSGGYDRANVIENFRKYMQEEPVSENLDLGCGVIWKGEELVSEDLVEAAITAADEDMQGRQIMEESNENRQLYSRIFRRGFKAGAKWQKQQMMANAIDGTLLKGHLIKQEGITHPLHSGDKVKIIIIKED